MYSEKKMITKKESNFTEYVSDGHRKKNYKYCQKDTNIQLSIIIPARNEAEYLHLCLLAIIKACKNFYNYEIIVVDNNSSDETVGIAKKFKCEVVRSIKHGAGSSRNRGAEVARGIVLAFIDADCIVNDGLFEFALKILQEKENVCVGTKIAPDFKSATWVEKTNFLLNKRRGLQLSNSLVKVKWIGTSNMIIRKSDFDKIGGFKEQYVTCEDYEICDRLNKIGDIIYNTKLNTIHLREDKTLLEVFNRERWRGQDSLQHWLEKKCNFHEAPSILLPGAYIILICLCIICFFITPFISIILFFILILLPSILVFRSNKGLPPITFLQGGIVSATYLSARGVALVYELKHLFFKNKEKNF